MVLVKFEASYEDFCDVWINKDRIEIVRKQDDEGEAAYPGCSWVFLIGVEGPFTVKGTPEEVVKLIREA